MSAPALALPDDVDALKAMVVAMAEKAAGLEERNADLEAHNTHLELVNKSAEERIARLTAVVKMLERSRFGSRSERLRTGALSEEQYALVFDEIETGVAAIEAQMEKAAGGSKAKRAARPRKGFAAHLERVEVVIEPETPAGCEGLEKILIGEDVSERLDVTPAKFRVIVTRRPKYAFKGWDGVIQAAAPARIIESGIATEALLAQIAVSKYADGLPLYRQEAIYARDQVEIDRSQMAQWMGKVGFELEPLADYALASRASASLPMRPRCQRWRRDRARPRQPICGLMSAMIGPLAAADRPSSPTASRTVAPANASPAIWTAIAASCRLMAMPPITGWPSPIGPMTA